MAAFSTSVFRTDCQGGWNTHSWYLPNIGKLLFLWSAKNFGGAYSRRVVRPSVCRYVRLALVSVNFVVCGWIKILQMTNDSHNKTTCPAKIPVATFKVTGQPW